MVSRLKCIDLRVDCQVRAGAIAVAGQDEVRTGGNL
jgi:hypothetical protein